MIRMMIHFLLLLLFTAILSDYLASLPSELIRYNLISILDLPALVNLALVSKATSTFALEQIHLSFMDNSVNTDGIYYPSSEKLLHSYRILREELTVGGQQENQQVDIRQKNLLLYMEHRLKCSLTKGNIRTDPLSEKVHEYDLRAVFRMIKKKVPVESNIFESLKSNMPDLLKELLVSQGGFQTPEKPTLYGADQSLVNWSIEHGDKVDWADQFLKACIHNGTFTEDRFKNL